MAGYKRIIVSVPTNLLQEVDGIVALEAGRTRSELIREALWCYIEERKKRALRERLKQGYQEMATLNLQLAEEGVDPDAAASGEYENYLAECEGQL